MKRDVTPEEKKLWEEVTRNDKPLSKNRQLPPKPSDKKQSVSSRSSSLPPGDAHVVLPDVNMDTPLHCGAYAGVDRKTAERFRKGKYPLDAVLDLHGQSREKAHRHVYYFLHQQYEQGARCVLVITGKGKQEEKGVLRELLPEWLAESGLRPLVLAFDMARQQHGGRGAYYILLRRKR